MAATSTLSHSPATGKRSAGAFVFGLHLGFCSLLVAYSYWAIHLSNESDIALWGISAFSMSLLVWGLATWRAAAGSMFDLYSIFFILAGIFNAGQLYLEVFGLNERGLLNGMFSDELLLESAVLVNVCLSFLHLGALATSLIIPTPLASGERTHQDDARGIALVGWVLLMVSILPALGAMVNAVNIAISQGYIGLYQQEQVTGVDNWSSTLAALFIPALLFVLVGSKEHRLTVTMTVLIVAVYTTVYLFVGRRAEALMPAMAFLWAYDRVISRVPRSMLIGAAMILVTVILPVSRVFRATTGEDRLSAGSLVESYMGIENPAVNAIAEMGGSLSTVAYTLELVPTYRPFDQGFSYLYGALTAAPNLFWDIHPSVQRGTPSSWLVWTVDPVTASSGGGLGYSFIAEAYLNFGWLGAPVVTALVGASFGGLSLWAQHSKSPLVVAGVGSFVSFTLFYVRSDSSMLFRPAVWYALVPCCLVLVIRGLTRRGSAARASRPFLVRLL